MRQPRTATGSYSTYMLHNQSLDIDTEVHEIKTRHVRSCGYVVELGGGGVDEGLSAELGGVGGGRGGGRSSRELSGA